MSDVEYFAKLEPKRNTSLAEDWKSEQKQFLEDEMRNAMRRSGKLKTVPVEITYERFHDEGGS